MGTPIKVSSLAWNDLAEIIDYIAQDSPDTAERFGKQLLEAAHSLQHTPVMGCRVKGRAKVRMTVYRSYLIFYRLNTMQNQSAGLRG